MAINNFKEYQDMLANKAAKQSNNANNSPSIQFFKLAPNETVLVRFNISSVDDIPVASVHHSNFGQSFEGNKNRFAPVKCLQENCPFCVAAAQEGGHKVVGKKSFRLFIQMMVSRFDATTQTWGEAIPMVWERSAAFGSQLDVKIKQLNGAPLSNALCTISRTGSTKDDTVYSVDFALPAIYPDNLITHDMSAFDNLKLNKFSYYEKSEEEMTIFLQTGKFPEAVNTNNEQNTQNAVSTSPEPKQAVLEPTSQFTAAEVNPFNQQPVNSAPVNTTSTAKKSNWLFN